MTVVTVAAPKGGVGKTTLAYELAAALDAVLVDLDWDQGGATRMWGWDPTAPRRRARLLDALGGSAAGIPRPLVADRRPRLLPSHPMLAVADRVLPDGRLAARLPAWSRAYGRAVVCDTHPGANWLAQEALAGADCVVVPTVLGQRELDALEAFLGGGPYALDTTAPVVLVPMMVGAAVPRILLRRLRSIATARAGVAVAPPVGEHRFLRRRAARSAVVLTASPGHAVRAAAAEFTAVADTVADALHVVPARARAQ